MTKRGGIFVEMSFDEWHASDTLTLKSGFYDDLKIVDSRCRLSQLSRAFVISYSGFLGWLSIPLVRRKVHLSFEHSPPAPISLDAVKTHIFEALDRGSEMWEEAFDVTSKKVKIASANTLEEVFSHFRM